MPQRSRNENVTLGRLVLTEPETARVVIVTFEDGAERGVSEWQIATMHLLSVAGHSTCSTLICHPSPRVSTLSAHAASEAVRFNTSMTWYRAAKLYNEWSSVELTDALTKCPSERRRAID